MCTNKDGSLHTNALIFLLYKTKQSNTERDKTVASPDLCEAGT